MDYSGWGLASNSKYNEDRNGEFVLLLEMCEFRGPRQHIQKLSVWTSRAADERLYVYEMAFEKWTKNIYPGM